ncbi:hypothetical protein B0H13DRAFT_1887447 [Mycena leptocephala]|nr:hypothetical protein B0H13DRAFT_1887447 [Mycena leptocephala]
MAFSLSFTTIFAASSARVSCGLLIGSVTLVPPNRTPNALNKLDVHICHRVPSAKSSPSPTSRCNHSHRANPAKVAGKWDLSSPGTEVAAKLKFAWNSILPELKFENTVAELKFIVELKFEIRSNRPGLKSETVVDPAGRWSAEATVSRNSCLAQPFTSTVAVMADEISGRKYFGLPDKRAAAGTCNKQERLLTYTTSLQVVRSWNSFYPDGLYHKTREGHVLELCQAN